MSAQSDGLGGGSASELYHNVTCPFCGLLCDDLEVSRTGSTLNVVKNGCPRASAGFERVLPAAKPMVDGKETSLEAAIAAAAARIRAASLPLYGGMATDVEGARAVMSLADRTCGVVDHALSEGQYRNIKVVQTSGWIMSTLTETRNRADLIVIVGSDVHKLHSRFFERIVCPAQTMFEGVAQKRTIVFIGEGLDTSAAKGPRIGEVITLPCPNSRLTELLGVLSARLRGASIKPTRVAEQKRGGLLSAILPQSWTGTAPVEEIAGVKLAEIDAIVEKFKKADYGVMVWAPPAFNFPNADLAVHLISEIVKDLNVTTRFAGLSLGGNEGAPSAASVATWQTGYPLRVSFANGKPEYDSYRYSIGRMVAEDDGDLLVWLASFTTDIGPPSTRMPTIVLGTPGIRMSQPPAVFIPVGTPGIDHAGTMIRCDNVVSLPMKNLGRSQLPRAADVLAAIEKAI
jgi:formylmethanofuran dehydrogenase subunit B